MIIISETIHQMKTEDNFEENMLNIQHERFKPLFKISINIFFNLILYLLKKPEIKYEFVSILYNS
jgi:hypothetical protein